jgi:hypothetical protein
LQGRNKKPSRHTLNEKLCIPQNSITFVKNSSKSGFRFLNHVLLAANVLSAAYSILIAALDYILLLLVSLLLLLLSSLMLPLFGCFF